jgi:uncharacterized protein YbcV (DUF1398 family)
LKYKAKLRARVEADAASVRAQTIEVPQVALVAATSSDFVKTTLETAVSEGWTKTKTIEELRKSEEHITIKTARELTKEAFEAKNAPIETPAKVAATSSDFVKTTLETAVSEGWTKTKTIEELRKSEEHITIKTARELTKEAFEAKNAPIETPAKIAATSSDFVKTTLETAVSEGWTKTKTIKELRKSEEHITIKTARDLVKVAFETKSEPIAIKA